MIAAAILRHGNDAFTLGDQVYRNGFAVGRPHRKIPSSADNRIGAQQSAAFIKLAHRLWLTGAAQGTSSPACVCPRQCTKQAVDYDILRRDILRQILRIRRQQADGLRMRALSNGGSRGGLVQRFKAVKAPIAPGAAIRTHTNKAQ